MAAMSSAARLLLRSHGDEGVAILTNGPESHNQSCPLPGAPKMSGKPIAHGVTRIPSMFGGRLVARRAGQAVRTTGVFIQVRAAEMRNTLVLLYLVYECS